MFELYLYMFVQCCLLSDFFVFLMVMHCYDGCLSDFFIFFLVSGFFFFNQAGVLCLLIERRLMMIM